jgi:hypothetical protein
MLSFVSLFYHPPTLLGSRTNHITLRCRGYQLWNAVLGGQVPCYSSLKNNLVPPAVPVTSTAPDFAPVTNTGGSAAGSSAAATSILFETPTATQIPTSAVVNIVFAIQYNVIPSTSQPGLSTGAKAGIGVGASLAAFSIITLSLLLLWRTRKHKTDKKVLAAIQATRPEATSQGQGEMTSKVPVAYSTQTELQTNNFNHPVQAPGNVVSQEQLRYHPQQQQQQMKTQEGGRISGYSEPQEGQYMQQEQAELPLHRQSPTPDSENYGYQTGYAELRTPGDQFVSSTASSQPAPQGYGYQLNYSTAPQAINTAPIFQQ